MERVFVIFLQIGLDGEEFGVEGFAPALPFAKDFERHEVLAENGGDEDAVFLGDDFLGDAAFFFDEERRVAVCWAERANVSSVFRVHGRTKSTTYLCRDPCTRA